jgi:hypothetical protein
MIASHLFVGCDLSLAKNRQVICGGDPGVPQMMEKCSRRALRGLKLREALTLNSLAPTTITSDRIEPSPMPFLLLAASRT